MVNSYISFNLVFKLVGMITETYLYGGRVLINLVSISIGYVISFFILNPFFYDLDKDIKSPYQYLEKRYNHKIIRIISAFAGFLFHLLFLSLNLWGCTIILATIYPQLQLWVAILIIGLSCMIASLSGGFKQSLKIGILQFILMIFGILSALIISFSYNGIKTSAELWEIAHEYNRRNFIYVDMDIRTRHTIINQIFSFSIPWCTFHAIFLPNYTKYRSISTKLKSRLILISHLPVMFSVIGSFVFSGIACFVYFYDCDPIITKEVANKNQIASYWVLKSLGNRLPSLAGLCLASVTFFAMSQYSIGIGSCAKLIINDIINPIKMIKLTDFIGKIVKIIVCLVIGSLSIILSILYQYSKNSIIALFFLFNNSINSPILGLFILSMFNPYSNVFGASLAFVCNLSINI